MSGRLLFNDEFNSFDPYSTSDGWRTAYHWGSSTVINGEKGYYVDTENAGPGGAVNPFSVSGGVLTITSAPALSALPTGQPYTSGVISSMGGFERQYGYYEIRADMPGGAGFWPAFWLMPADRASPPELDVMEFASVRANEYVTTAHSNAGGSYRMSQLFTYGLPNLSEGFHTYAADWQADKITWYFDDRAVYSIATPGDFHKPMYMLLNQAVGGGAWIGPPDGSTQRFDVDYVRVYDSRPGGAPPAPPVTPPPATPPSTPAEPIVSPVMSAAMSGTDGADFLRGGAGSDSIRGGLGGDQLFGGDGADLLYGNGGADALYGNAGDDTLYAGQDDDTLYAGQGADLLQGDFGSDQLFGDNGNDAVNGNAGNDRIAGNAGNDTLRGGQDDDSLRGGQNDDWLYGDLGDDSLWGDMGNDVLEGGGGADLFAFAAGSGHDVIADFAPGTDRIRLEAGQGYSIRTSAAGHAVIAFTEDDQLTLLGIQAGQVTGAFFASA